MTEIKLIILINYLRFVYRNTRVKKNKIEKQNVSSY